MKNILSMKLNKKGFTLIELLVAMAIIAVLIAIAAFGIAILNRNSRNTQRRKILSDIQLLVTDLQTNYQTRFDNIRCVTAGGTQISVETIAGQDEVYTLPGRFTCIDNNAQLATACATAALVSVTNPTSNQFHIEFDVPTGTICTSLEDSTAAATSNSPIFRIRAD